MSRSDKLFSVFVVYMAILFLFAYIYQLEYEYDRNNFFFSSDIAKRQKELFEKSAEEDIPLLEIRLRAFRQLLDLLAHLPSPVKSDRLPFELSSEEFTYQFQKAIVIDKYPIDGGITFIDKNTQKSIFQERVKDQFGDLRRTYKKQISAQIEAHEAALQDYHMRLGTLGMSSPHIWRYWDFLYFSTITQATVGYGDILPNALCVRVTVAIQVLVGLAIATFALALYSQ